MLKKLLDQVLVIDLEATCWDGNPPEGQEHEIIEIGICMLDLATGTRLEKESIIVKPRTSTVSDFCTKLTTLTQAMVETGISFEDACDILKIKYLSRRRTWASWGDYDRRQFEKQCNAQGIPYPFGPTHLNIKNLLAITYNLSHEVGMDHALQLLGLPLEGRHHRAVDDAYNIAGILAMLIRNLRRH